MEKKMLGRRINLARKECGFTSEKLAELCNINATYLRQIEAGTKVPSLPVFVTICDALKVSPSFLLADSLQSTEAKEMDELTELWNAASPKQIKMITRMVKSALTDSEE